MRLLALMQGAAQAAQDHGAAESGPDLQYMLTHHLLDGPYLEFVILGIDITVPLPHFDPIAVGSLDDAGTLHQAVDAEDRDVREVDDRRRVDAADDGTCAAYHGTQQRK